MAEEVHDPPRRPMREFACPDFRDTEVGIAAPPVAANSFEIKPACMAMVSNNQFGGSPTEDPRAHLKTFIKICNTFKINGMTSDAIRLRLFPFSLRGKAARWEESLEPGVITTWSELVEAFLNKFFPPCRTANLAAEITSFKQWDNESLYETWDRYKELLRRCPHHGLPDWLVLQLFNNGLSTRYQTEITAAAGGSLMNKTYEDAVTLLDDLAEQSYASQRGNSSKRPQGVFEVDEAKAINARLDALTSQIKSLTTSTPPMDPSFHELAYPDEGPMYQSREHEQVQFVQNQNRGPNQPYGNTYNPSWKKHPGFSYAQQQSSSSHPPPQADPRPPPYRPPYQRRVEENPMHEPRPNFEEQMLKFMSRVDSTMAQQNATLSQHSAAIQSLERQIGQLADARAQRQPGTFPSQPEGNPGKETGKMMEQRGGRVGDTRGREDAPL